MAQYFAIINSDESFPLFHWDSNSFRGNQQLHIATDDLAHVREVLNPIKSIEIVDNQNNQVAYFTEYDGYSSINYLGRNHSGQLDGFANELVVTLTKVDLVAQVQRIDEKVNPIIDFDGMSLQEYKNWKIDQLSDMGEATIFAGTDVTLTDGTTKNFTYDLEDQSNLLNAIFIIQALDDLTLTIPYHGHGEPCELYSALDILAVYIHLQMFSTTVQTLVNMKINWVRECTSKEEVQAIEYSTPLPDEWMERANSILIPAAKIVEDLTKKYFPEGTPEPTPAPEPEVEPEAEPEVEPEAEPENE